MARSDPSLDFVVDLSRAGLDKIEETDAELTVGAVITLQAWLVTPATEKWAGGLVAAALRATRTEPWRRQSTAAGRLLEAEPTDRLAPALMILGAQASVRRPGGTQPVRLPIEDVLQAHDPTSLVLALHVPRPSPGWAFASESIGRSMLDAPLAVVCVGVRVESRRIVEARVATAGLPHPRRAPNAEAALRNTRIDRFESAQEALERDISAPDDWRASAASRVHWARVLLARALRTASQAAERPPRSTS
jgi:CO/xanthine dehydrogenase FAD-binding subunit